MMPVLLSSISDFVWWVETNISSVVLFGEYPIPSEEADD